MLRNYFTIAWRNLAKNKVFSLINIAGLTIAITVCMMIYLFILNEYSVDNFHVKSDRIYRLRRSFLVEGTNRQAVWVSYPYATALLNDFPDMIEKAVRVRPDNDLFTLGDRSFNEPGVYKADSDFFSFFSFPLVKGDPATALKDPRSVVLTESTAKKYFGDRDPIGQVIEMDRQVPLKVTGVARDVPPNSHLQFDIVVNQAYEPHDTTPNAWPNNGWFTYVLLKDHTNPEALRAALPAFMEKYMGKAMRAQGFHFKLEMTALPKVYFESTSYDPVRHGDKAVVFVFVSIAALILLIACINFTNLSTVRAVERSKEVGLRKVLGALKSHLVRQFIGESILLTAVSCLLSVAFLAILMPAYNQLLGRTLVVSWSTWPLYVFLVGVTLLVGFVAGCYPAFVLSAFKPIESLKGKLRLGKGGSFFRQALVVVQFGISVFLIVGTLVMMNQLYFVQHTNVGYNRDQTVVVSIDNYDIYNHRRLFKTTLEGQPGIESVSMMSGDPGGFFDGMGFKTDGRNDQVFNARTEFSDFQIVPTLGLKVVAGRDFSPSFPTDSTDAVLVNKSAAAQLGYTPAQALGHWVQNTSTDNKQRRIVGVVDDFNFQSLKEEIEPLIITPGADNRVILIRVQPGALRPALRQIGEAYKRAAPAYPFEYHFLDQDFNELYKTDERQQTILGLFSGLAILIACLGLFGLASFTTARRFKEIGVRKVLGSSVRNIVLLLVSDLLRPILLGTLIAVPIGYYVMHHWVENFAYRTAVHWWIFAGAAGLTCSIALATVGGKALRAAMASPARSLRTE
ncbi:ABC transporter permease [Dinghuibacter silviterrae]|uniref:Putative ABC transport system permease protein n=1 Tax=Dinghuibacter silviterrae TaxID=1539049 RepID=A0A4R8DHJ9_9BACT|nr:ABC transporter permease [Dinghuibacter silviterrae]TDW97203.1 putative ABC transport system permease protein [Dinghuibacter silviterrae]